ncbi:MAG TPA: hypothetical protein EYP40_03065 [Chromatiales bacterium]|nr:hypothetical protein [Chromatiales bacterium]
MIGKKNVVFGFLYLVLTAALGIVMVNKYEDFGAAMLEKQASVGRLQQLKENGFEEELEPLPAGQIARANTDGVLALNKLRNIEMEIDSIKGGAHAHGNLESLLNIAAGLALGFVAVAGWLKQLISWLFILGTLLHSGMLYLGRVLGQGWADVVLDTGVGPLMILAALLLMGIAAGIGFRGEIIRD